MKTKIINKQLKEATLQVNIENKSTSESYLSFQIKELQLHEDIENHLAEESNSEAYIIAKIKEVEDSI